MATSLVVREDALTLYGFAADDERNTFELLQTASGVGPRLALAMLAVFTPDALRRAVATEDLAALTTVPGIGRKGAQRIVLELAGRLGSPGDGLAAGRAGGAAAAAPRPRPGGIRCGRAWSAWAGRPATPTRPSPRSSLSWRPGGTQPRVSRGRAGRRRGGGPAGRAARAGAHVTGRPGRARSEAGRGRGAEQDAEDRVVSALADADDRVIEGALRPRRLSRVRRPGPGPRAAVAGAGGRAAPRPAAGPRAAVRAARPGQDHDRHDHRGRARRAAAASPAGRPSSGPATWPRSCPR